jgi:nitroreductase
MDIDKCLRERRSVRSYLDKNVSAEKINELLEAARYAPSSGNIQNWSFIIIRDKKIKMELAEVALKQYWMVDAPVLIVVCNKVEKIRKFYGIRGELMYSIQNCAAASQNILLKAYSLGLSTCWIGAFDEDAVGRILGLPEDVKAEAMISVGYSDEKEEMPIRNELEDIVYFEKWGKKEKESLIPLEKHKGKIKENIKKIKKRILKK